MGGQIRSSCKQNHWSFEAGHLGLCRIPYRIPPLPRREGVSAPQGLGSGRGHVPRVRRAHIVLDSSGLVCSSGPMEWRGMSGGIEDYRPSTLYVGELQWFQQQVIPRHADMVIYCRSLNLVCSSGPMEWRHISKGRGGL